MPLQLQYELGPATYLAHRRHMERGVPRAFLKGYLSWCALVAGVSFLGVVTAAIAQSLLLGMAFAGVLVGIAFHAASYKKHYEAAVSADVARIPARTVSLRIDDSGLHEVVSEVESFAPWSAVKSYALTSDTVLISLASGHWSLIPLSAFERQGEDAAASVVAVFDGRSIPRVSSEA
ncbi:YcxB family protein [Ramlibacter humi]|uniref:YcxB family protein n=1 Tax=Ramlibacter humi TaxID=2530451 RepID=A0A4Z0BBY3_9BURK|nr:YcxB family protein [Ramlibacter humi]TFY96712.1 YcxB family protein [Ramlibacter humi]